MKTFLWILPLAFITTLSTSCVKKGCTDTDAVNYDSDANSDDGTCCVGNKVEVSKSHQVQDTNSELVVAIVAKKTTTSYSGTTCNDLGYGSDRCENKVILTSNRPESISYTYTVEFGPGQAWIVSETANLGPWGHQETLVDTSCEDYDIDDATFDVGPITYN